MTPAPVLAHTVSQLMIAGDQSTPAITSMQNAYLITKTYKIPLLKI
jgi:hypothetical protein